MSRKGLGAVALATVIGTVIYGIGIGIGLYLFHHVTLGWHP